jgi:hypothetical protein
MTFPHSEGPFVFNEWGSCSDGSIVFVEVAGREQPPLAGDTMVSMGSDFVLMSLVDSFLECHLSEDPSPGCRSYTRPNSSPPPDPVEGFCGDLDQLRGWFSEDVANANGDEEALAAAVKYPLGGVMMWFAQDEQAIPAGTARTAADEIIVDTLALQTWETSSKTPFTELLATFNHHAEAFTSRYCS